MCKSFVYMVRVYGTVWTVTNIEKIKDRLLTFREAQCSREEEKKPLRNPKGLQRICCHVTGTHGEARTRTTYTQLKCLSRLSCLNLILQDDKNLPNCLTYLMGGRAKPWTHHFDSKACFPLVIACVFKILGGIYPTILLFLGANEMAQGWRAYADFAGHSS